MKKFYSSSIWFTATLFVMYELFINNGFYGVTTPLLASDLGLTNEDFGALAAISFMVYAIFQIPAGILISRYNVKIILTIATLFVAFGMALYSIADSFNMLATSRATIALGSAFAFVGSATLIGRWFSSDKFPIAFGLTQALGNISVVSANIFLPQIIRALNDWKTVAFGLCVAGIIIAALCFVIIRSSPNKVVVKTQLELAPILKALFKNKEFWVVVAFASALIGTLFNFGGNWQIVFQHNFTGNTLRESAQINSVMFLGFAIGAPIMGALSSKLKSRRKIMIFSSFASVVIMGVALFGSKLDDDAAEVLYFLFGFSCSGGILAYTVIMELLPNTAKSVGIGACNGAVYFSGAIISLIIGIIQNYFEHILNNHLLIDKISFSLFFFALIQAFIFSLFIKESYKNENVD